LINPNTWINDSGSIVHSSSNVKLTQDWKQENNNIDGKWPKEKVTKIGKVTGIVKNCEYGIQGNITLPDVMFLSNGHYNLIIITKVIQSGWKLEANENMILMRKQNKVIIFDIKIETS
jgi:hypothetical protein